MSLRLVLAGGVLTACVLAWAVQGDQTGRIASHLVLYGAAFVAYLVALEASRSLSPRGLGLALGAAFLWRAALVLAPPLLSDDVYRSVWEGRIQRHGGNPYAWTDRPAAAKWGALRDAVWQNVNHKDDPAIYPPLWQMAVRAVVALCDSVAAMKGFLVGCELAALGLLDVLLKRRGLPRGRLLVLAWSPLALVEIAGGGHNDAFGMLFLVVSLLALDVERPLASALAATLGAGAKFLPGAVALAWARRYRPGHALAALGLAAVLVLPYGGAVSDLLRGLSRYAGHWRFNETLFAPLAAFGGGHVAGLRLSCLVLAALAAALAWRRAQPTDAALGVVSAWLLLAPDVLPWYALWLLPLLVLRDAPPALLFTGTVGLAYLVYPAWQSGEPWRVGWGIRALEYGPCLVLAAGQALRAGSKRVGVAGSIGGP